MLLLGIDIGGTKIAAGVVEGATGRVLVSDRIPTDAGEGGRAVLARATHLARRLAAGHRIEGVGIGAGGQIDPQTGTVTAALEKILPGWVGIPLKRAFAEALGVPAAVDNDVNALAVGERRFGAARGTNNVLFLALGTGVGGALIVDGQLYRGAHGAGGELGQLHLRPGETLESRCAGPALWSRYLDVGGDPSAAPRSLAEQADAVPGGPAARAIAGVAEDLGWGLVSLANLLDPERIVVGGGLLDLGERMLGPARRVLRENGLTPVRATPVIAAALGADAAIVGAASLVL